MLLPLSSIIDDDGDIGVNVDDGCAVSKPSFARCFRSDRDKVSDAGDGGGRVGIIAVNRLQNE
jgi:hypothetical protein